VSPREGPLDGERITAAAIARDNRDLRLTGQPGLDRGGLPVAASEAGGGSAAERKRQAMDDLIEPSGSRRR
jgi:hypothetical protein